MRARLDPGHRFSRAESARAVVELGVECERAGLDALFLGASRVLDPYVVLGAVAASTRELVVGCLAAPVGERPSSVLAKVVTGLDVCAKGRAVLGIRAAPDRATAPTEPRTEANPTGRGALAEALEVCRAMVRVPSPRLPGSGGGAEGAWNEPRLAGLPIAVLVPLVGSDEGAVVAQLELAARFAEICVVDVGDRVPERGRAPVGASRATGALSDGEWLSAAFSAACLEAGRPPGEVSLLALCAAGQGAADLLGRAGRWTSGVADGVVVDVEVPTPGSRWDPELLRAVASLAC